MYNTGGILHPGGVFGRAAPMIYLWLPLAASRYVATTGDTGVLDSRIQFIEGRPINADERLVLRSSRPVRAIGECL